MKPRSLQDSCSPVQDSNFSLHCNATWTCVVRLIAKMLMYPDVRRGGVESRNVFSVTNQTKNYLSVN